MCVGDDGVVFTVHDECGFVVGFEESFVVEGVGDEEGWEEVFAGHDFERAEGGLEDE